MPKNGLKSTPEDTDLQSIIFQQDPALRHQTEQTHSLMAKPNRASKAADTGTRLRVTGGRIAAGADKE
ncbi:MAG: hypothetical protein QXK96_06435 [Candidatus Bathyarchaeia archaeon]